MGKQVWNGDRRHYHNFIEHSREKWKSQKVETSVRTSVRNLNMQVALVEVQIVKIYFRRYNIGYMDATELTRERGATTVALWVQIVSGYEKNDTDSREKGDGAMQVLESMIRDE